MAFSEEMNWCDAQYETVVDYVKSMAIPHGVICEWPEWDCEPYLALWAVEDPLDPGFIGHWVLGGDSSGTQPQPVPFDHLPAEDLSEPREALAAFAKKWATLAKVALQGETWQGSPMVKGDLEAQAAQLKRQAELLHQLADDDDLWLDD